MQRSQIVSVLILGLAACAGNPEPDSPLLPPTRTDPQVQLERASAFDPVGNYEFLTTVEGQSVPGTIEIQKNEQGSLTARVSTDMTGPIPITSITIEGMKVTMTGSLPDGQLGFIMEFKDLNEFSGSWSYAGMGGAFNGKRKA